MYNVQFAIDKSCAAIYEGIAIHKIEQWYAAQGFRIHARYNEANGLEQKRGYDLIDTYGKKWEVKCDRKALSTGNVFVEHQALDHSEADYWIILAGLAYILPRQSLLDARNEQYRVVRGGDDLRAIGTLLPLSELKSLAEIV